MPIDINYDADQLRSLIGGLYTLDVAQLHIDSADEAIAFLRAYGYDPAVAEDEQRLWAYYRRALTYIQTELLSPGEEVPEVLADPKSLGRIEELILAASGRGLGARASECQRFACAILKVAHVLVHLDNDLFAQYSLAIQEQILKPIAAFVHSDPATGVVLRAPGGDETISLHRFETKPFKASDSSVTKLLAKPEMVAFTILDKVGVRFVTKHLADTFRLLRFLVRHHIVSFPHNVPDQANNTLFPTNIFFEVLAELDPTEDLPVQEFDERLRDRLAQSMERGEFRRRYNSFSGENYRFMKFITRRLIRITDKNDQHQMSFFYPYEIQVMDYATFLNNLTGPASHEAYKERQRQSARRRLLGFGSAAPSAAEGIS